MSMSVTFHVSLAQHSEILRLAESGIPPVLTPAVGEEPQSRSEDVGPHLPGDPRRASARSRAQLSMVRSLTSLSDDVGPWHLQPSVRGGVSVGKGHFASQAARSQGSPAPRGAPAQGARRSWGTGFGGSTQRAFSPRVPAACPRASGVSGQEGRWQRADR